MVARTTGRRLHRTTWDQPQVPIIGPRVRACIDTSNWSTRSLGRELARRGVVGASQQTLSYICTGRNKTCRAPLRKALAREFNVPEQWLGDPDVYIGSRLSTDHLLHMAEDAGRDPNIPPIAELIAFRLGRKIADAWYRDLDAGTAPPIPPPLGLRDRLLAVEQLERGLKPPIPPPGAKRDRPPNWPAPYVTIQVFQLFSTWNWRHLILKSESVEWQIPEKDTADFVTAFAKAIEALLAPWLAGKAELNYERFSRLLQLLGDTPLTPKPKSRKKKKRAVT